MTNPWFALMLRSVAVTALLHISVAVTAPIEAWAADEVQVIRRSEPNNLAAVPFTTFQQEQNAVTQYLPCKWISKDGRVGPSYGGGRYDFLCKGGEFATISLYLDKAGSDGVGKVRLLYREWDASANPGAGEAKIAQQYLQHVIGRFVPASAAAQVMDTYWGRKSRQWSHDNVDITFDLEEGDDGRQPFMVRKLTIVGKGRPLGAARASVPSSGGLLKPLVDIVTPDKPNIPVQVYQVGPNGEKLPPKVAPLPVVGEGLTLPVNASPTVVLPQGSPILPQPRQGGELNRVPLDIPPSTPAGGDTTVKPELPGTVVPASPAELMTAPEPESKIVPVAPEISATLVPTTTDLKTGAQRAPSNFDIYNKAMELTRSTEERAQITKVNEARVTASVQPSATQVVTPTSVVAPRLTPLPTPGEAAAATAPSVPAGEGLAKPVMPTEEGARPLPQLRFVPKAEPIKTPDEVLQFEDEKSRL